MTTNERSTGTARRTLLKAVAAAGGVAGTGLAGGPTAVLAQEGEDDEDGDDRSDIPEGPLVRLESVAEGLTSPLALEADDGSDRRFVVDQAGQIYILGEDGLEDEPFLDLEDRLVDLQEGFDERGLLGLALHPDFAENGRFFVRYSAPPRDADPEEYVPPREEVPDDYDHTFVLSEFETADDDNAEADPDSERVLLEIPQPQFNHNAGPIAFGPDGYLYVATGDGGGANDADEGHVDDWYDENEGGNGQNTTENLLGGILRIDVDDGEGEAVPEDDETAGDDEEIDEPADENETDDVDDNETGADDNETDDETEVGDDETGGDAGDDDARDERPYGIPEDNPFAEDGEFDSEEGLEEYYAWGLRNPWGMAFHGDTLFVADVGQELYEEVNVVEKGGNYGWNVKEGTHCFSTDSPGEPPEDCPDETPDDVRGGEPLLDPVVEYPQETDDEVIGNSVIGGHVAETDTIPDLQGAYVFGDWGQTVEEPEGGKLFVAHPPDDEDLLEDDADADGENGADDEADVGDDGETDVGDDNETEAGDDETEIGDDNETDVGDDNETNVGNDNETDVGDDNETDDDETDVGTDNETDEVDGDDNETDDAADGSEDDALGEELWEMEELLVNDPDGPPEERQTPGLNRFLLSVGRDADGELYALTTENQGPQGETGEVFRLAAPEGEDGEGADDGEDGADEDGEEDGGDGDGTQIRLTGVESGWEGEEPDEIAGETNPTLEFSAGETVTVEWENGDGLPHNFVVENDDGEELVETDLVSSFGETQTVEFEATEEMAEYYCRPHSGTMRGDVSVDG